MQKMLSSLSETGFELCKPESAHNLPDVLENGGNPLENARMKAKAYYEVMGVPVFSCDSGLYSDDLPEELQPGVHIRRVSPAAQMRVFGEVRFPQERLDDNAMQAYYGALAEYAGGGFVCRYRNAVCLVTKDGLFEHYGDDIASLPFIMCGKPHPKLVEGFPLDSLSVHIRSGKYYYDYTGPRSDDPYESMDKGFCDFFRSALNLHE